MGTIWNIVHLCSRHPLLGINDQQVLYEVLPWVPIDEIRRWKSCRNHCVFWWLWDFHGRSFMLFAGFCNTKRQTVGLLGRSQLWVLLRVQTSPNIVLAILRGFAPNGLRNLHPSRFFGVSSSEMLGWSNMEQLWWPPLRLKKKPWGFGHFQPLWMVFRSFKGKNVECRQRHLKHNARSFLDSGRVSWWSFHPAGQTSLTMAPTEKKLDCPQLFWQIYISKSHGCSSSQGPQPIWDPLLGSSLHKGTFPPWCPGSV